MKEAGDVRLEDVVEVVVRASDVVEGSTVEKVFFWKRSVCCCMRKFDFPHTDFCLGWSSSCRQWGQRRRLWRGSCPPGFLRTSQKEDNEEAGFAWWSSEVWTSDPRVLCLYAKEFRKEERAKKGKRKVTATTTSADDAGPPPLPSKPAKRAGKTGPKT